MVDWSRNDGVMGGMWRERGKGESVSISHPIAVTNISPHRMYEMNLLGNICFSDIILTDTFASYSTLSVHRMC